MTAIDTHAASADTSAPALASLADWITTTDHKRIGRLYIGAALIALLGAGVVGALLAFERIDTATTFLNIGSLTQLFSLYRWGLLYLAAVPLVVGVAVAVVPMQLGARSIAFPRLAIGGFWIWQCKSKQEAIEWLKRAPFDEKEVEIREIIAPQDFAENFRRHEFDDRRLQAFVAEFRHIIDLDVGKPLGAVDADEGRVVVDFLARQRSTARHAQRGNAPVLQRRGVLEHFEIDRLHQIGDLGKFELDAQIRLVRTVARHCLGIADARKGTQIHIQRLLEHVAHQAFHDVLDFALVEERGFDVDLREFGLTIGAQILVDLGVTTMRLMTNNPVKIQELHTFGSLRGAGLSARKVEYARELAERSHAGEIRLHDLHAMSDHDVLTTLVQVRGIGRWTAQMVLMFHLGRPDVFPELDLGVQKGLHSSGFAAGNRYGEKELRIQVMHAEIDRFLACD